MGSPRRSPRRVSQGIHQGPPQWVPGLIPRGVRRRDPGGWDRGPQSRQNTGASCRAPLPPSPLFACTLGARRLCPPGRCFQKGIPKGIPKGLIGNLPGTPQKYTKKRFCVDLRSSKTQFFDYQDELLGLDSSRACLETPWVLLLGPEDEISGVFWG